MGHEHNIDAGALGIKVSIVSIILNILLSAGKFIAGVVAGSSAMVSDAIHSASDVISSFVVIVGLKIAAKKPDKTHPYGHERMECLAAIVL
ncbi:MAG: cation diffusion facilitator family transporter, partial [Eubacterium sp.]|nr:cation diffusion facilitator family transporter [Candidatus Colimonas fimequi]